MKRIVFAFFVLFTISIFADVKPVRSVAVAPLHTIGIDDVTKQTADSILLKEIEFQPNLKLISRNTTEDALLGKSCTNVEEAVKLGIEVNSDLVLIPSLNKLGEKILVHYILVNVKLENVILTDMLTAVTLEDLDMVMKRLAISVDKELKFNDTAEIGNITLYEEEEPRRRKARYYGGGTFGYLYPQKGFDGNHKETFIIDLRSGYEFENGEVGFLIGVRRGIATSVYASYLFSKKDICPFVGGSFGFRWITKKNTFFDNSTGLEAGIRAGVLLFRTYDFHVLINLEYTTLLTDEQDQSIIFTLGILSNIK
jgi:hypothetical protein